MREVIAVNIRLKLAGNSVITPQIKVFAATELMMHTEGFIFSHDLG